MTATVPASSVEQEEFSEEDLAEMVEEIGTAVAAGLVPFLGQAINIYDTIESLLTLHNSQGAAAEAEAKFDLVLALVGWIPGAGSGVKKTIRIVNKNPQRYAPILFDVLRRVCLKLGIYTSPELLLQKLFDAVGLKAILGTVQTSVEKSWAYEQMPAEGQQVLSMTMAMVRDSLPAMVLLVTTKLLHWRGMQRNTAARSKGRSKKDPAALKPAAEHPATAKAGANSPAHAPGNGVEKGVIGTETLRTVTNELLGMLGEHITDYFLYEKYGWGKDWSGHDYGVSGSWETKPGKEFPGKLNNRTKLNALRAETAHGVGIDGVWKVQLGDPHNGGKRYAIVESKASFRSKKPKNEAAKPRIASKLLSNKRRFRKAAEEAVAIGAKVEETVLPDPAELLDPPTGDPAGSAASQSPGRKAGARLKNKGIADQDKQKPIDNSASAQTAVASAGGEKLLVQMSRRWIRKNIRFAVKDPAILLDLRNNDAHVYSRHLFYTPIYLPTAVEHLLALQAQKDSGGAMHNAHENHSIPPTHRHDEHEVKMAVNFKLRQLKLEQEP
jgi:hypothetical protein